MKSRSLVLPGFILAGGFALIAFVQRGDFWTLCSLNLLLFLSWILIYKRGFKNQLGIFFALFLVCRLPFFFNLPELSDDFFRFLWDGMLLNEGLNPVGSVPADVIIDNVRSPQYARELLNGMNSSSYASIYPPIHQLCFAIAHFFGGSSLITGVNTLRFIILVSELVFLIFILTRRLRYISVVQLYLLNPLVVIEGVGNVHMEAALLPLLAASFVQLEARAYTSAALTWASSILVKLRPLILVPLLFRRVPANKRLYFFLLSGFTVLVFSLMFEPWKIFWNWSSGLGLYFGNFEFNASIYYLLREFVSLFTGYNTIKVISPLLSFISLILIVLISFKNIGVNLFEKALLVYVVFLLLSPTVHPWYLIPLVFFALASGRKLVLIWSFTACLSYSHYLEPLSAKPLFLIMEYGLLGLALYRENRRNPFIQLALRG